MANPIERLFPTLVCRPTAPRFVKGTKADVGVKTQNNVEFDYIPTSL